MVSGEVFLSERIRSVLKPQIRRIFNRSVGAKKLVVIAGNGLTRLAANLSNFHHLAQQQEIALSILLLSE